MVRSKTHQEGLEAMRLVVLVGEMFESFVSDVKWRAVEDQASDRA